jgi:hypothetical protein
VKKIIFFLRSRFLPFFQGVSGLHWVLMSSYQAISSVDGEQQSSWVITFAIPGIPLTLSFLRTVGGFRLDECYTTTDHCIFSAHYLLLRFSRGSGVTLADMERFVRRLAQERGQAYRLRSMSSASSASGLRNHLAFGLMCARMRARDPGLKAWVRRGCGPGILCPDTPRSIRRPDTNHRLKGLLSSLETSRKTALQRRMAEKRRVKVESVEKKVAYVEFPLIRKTVPVPVVWAKFPCVQGPPAQAVLPVAQKVLPDKAHRSVQSKVSGNANAMLVTSTVKTNVNSKKRRGESLPLEDRFPLCQKKPRCLAVPSLASSVAGKPRIAQVTTSTMINTTTATAPSSSRSAVGPSPLPPPPQKPAAYQYVERANDRRWSACWAV